MKKSLLAIAITVGACSFLFGVDGVVKGGFDLGGKWKMTVLGVSAEGDTENSFGLSFEVAETLNPNFTFGAGLEYQLQRKLTKIEGETIEGNPLFNFVPIYVLLKVHPAPSDSTPFGKIQLGYNILYKGNDDYSAGATLSGGLHYAIGGGLIIKNSTIIEILYSVYKGTVEVSSYGVSITGDTDYSKIGISIGYKFSLSGK